MLIMDELIPLRLYPAKRKVFVPFNEKDKKHGSAIFLMGTTQEENEKLMNMRYVYDPSKLFRSYYIDRNVMTYIDSDAINKLEDEEEEEFDELQEAVLSEGIIHTKKAKLSIQGGSTMDTQFINAVYSDDQIDTICRDIGLAECPVKTINVKVYTSLKILQRMSPYEDKAYSFSDDTTIHILSQFEYKEEDGPYKEYCLNELIYFLLAHGYPEVNPVFFRAIAMAMSGQVEYFRKENDGKEFKFKDSDKEGKENLYLADLIYDIYKSKGRIGIKRILNGDLSDIRKVSSGRMVKQISDLYNKYYHEATLTAEQRKNLKDSDYGLPDKKKYPMPDAAHVKAAIRFFNKCDKEDQPRLAKAIKSKMKKFNVDAKIGNDNDLSNYITESAVEAEKPVINYPGVEAGINGEIIMGNHSKEYYDVLAILDSFTMDEFKKVSFYSTYQDNKYIEKRIIRYDENGYPESFMDVYHFPSSPNEAQITTGVASHARGHHFVAWMFNELINSGWAEENNVTTYIWHANPENAASIKIATQELGFKGDTEHLDKYGRYTFRYYVDPPATNTTVVMPEIDTESGLMINESAWFVFNEADSKYDRKIKKYLYKERLRNASQVLSIYDQIKSRNSKIVKTFRNVKAYKGLNLYVDTSYYHELYLKNAPKNNKRTLYMYFDFISRLMENEDVFKNYNKITYFFPVKYTRAGNTIDSLLDWSTDLNIFSVMVYMLRRDPEVLKRWANKTILFFGDNGYFKIDFSNFTMKNLTKFKKNLKKILSKEEIPDVDEDEDDLSQSVISSKGNAFGVISSIEDKTGIDINNVSAVDAINLVHLSMNDTEPKNLVTAPEGTAILIIDTDTESVVNDIKSDALKCKEPMGYYKMR